MRAIALILLGIVACQLTTVLGITIPFCRIGKSTIDGWIGYGRSGKCFQLQTTPKTFDEANAECLTEGAVLANVVSLDEHRFLIHYILRDVKAEDLKSVWIGRKRVKSWYISMNLENYSYYDWHMSYANLPTNDTACVQLLTSASTDAASFGKFIEEPCTTKNSYICEKQDETFRTPLNS